MYCNAFQALKDVGHAFVEFCVFATVDVVDDIVGDINIHNDIYVVD